MQGRLTSKQYPDTSTVTYTYETTTSRLKSVTDALTQVKTYAYAKDDRHHLHWRRQSDAQRQLHVRSVLSAAHLDDRRHRHAAVRPRPRRLAGRPAYDGQLRLTSATDTVGRQTTFTYGLAARPLLVTQITDPFGRSAALTYDGTGRLASITDVLGITSSFAYDANSLVNSLATPYGTTSFSYTAPGTSAPPRFAQATAPQDGVVLVGPI